MTLRFPCSACPGFGFSLFVYTSSFFGYHYSTHGHLSLLSVLLLRNPYTVSCFDTLFIYFIFIPSAILYSEPLIPRL